MRFRSHQCWFPRDVERPHEYEDASAHSEKRGRAVIADGVSSAIFSRPWARLLTRTAVSDPPDLTTDEAIAAWVKPLQQAWQQEIRQAKISTPLWAVTPKINSIGGQATFLVVEIEPAEAVADGTYRLRAKGIGDSVLYLVRDGAKVLSFPITESAMFNSPPWVVSSIAKDIEYAGHVQHLETECRVGDLLVLCTDAIGKWSMQEYERGQSVDWMRYWQNDAAWQEDVVRLRARSSGEPGPRLVVDDCTLLLLQVVPETVDHTEPDVQPDRSDDPFVLLQTPQADVDGNATVNAGPGITPPPVPAAEEPLAAERAGADRAAAEPAAIAPQVAEDSAPASPAACGITDAPPALVAEASISFPTAEPGGAAQATGPADDRPDEQPATAVSGEASCHDAGDAPEAVGPRHAETPAAAPTDEAWSAAAAGNDSGDETAEPPSEPSRGFLGGLWGFLGRRRRQPGGANTQNQDSAEPPPPSERPMP